MMLMAMSLLASAEKGEGTAEAQAGEGLARVEQEAGGVHDALPAD